jgi:hypothetical protein
MTSPNEVDETQVDDDDNSSLSSLSSGSIATPQLEKDEMLSTPKTKDFEFAESLERLGLTDNDAHFNPSQSQSEVMGEHQRNSNRIS